MKTRQKLGKIFKNQIVVTSIGLGLAFSAHAGNLSINKALQGFDVPKEDISVWIAPFGESTPIYALNATRPRHPASVIKTVTTLAALELLGPAYKWKTHIYAKNPIDSKGVLTNVVFKGSGDPHYVIERMWATCERLRSRGVKKIQGDIVVDRSAFLMSYEERLEYKEDATRAYSVNPDAALLNQKTISIDFVPDTKRGVAHIYVLPRLTNFTVQKTVNLSNEPCINWRRSLEGKFTPESAVFKGAFPARCGKKTWPITLWEKDDFFTKTFSRLLKEVGIEWEGVARDGVMPLDVVEILEENSEPLSSIVGYTNKYSNNPMARHLFLSLSYSDELGIMVPATHQRARSAMSTWLARLGASPSEIVIENGSGLSKKTSISAQNLGLVLTQGAKSPFSYEFIASLPIAGVDGTMDKRPLPKGSAHVKTGRMRNVRSVAGYVRDAYNKDWTVVVMINTANADHLEDAIDKILAWVASGEMLVQYLQ